MESTNQNPQGRHLLRPKAAADYLKVSRSTIYELIGQGRLPRPTKLGQRITLIDRADLDRLLNTLT